MRTRIGLCPGLPPRPNQMLLLSAMGLFLMSVRVPAPELSSPSPELSLPTEAGLSGKPASGSDYANRLRANDPKVRATAAAALVQGGAHSLPLLKRFLGTGDEQLHQVTFGIARQIGPEAIPLLTEMLRCNQASIRRQAIDILIDLAPDTAAIQPALRRALRDTDSLVAGDAARALGALGKSAKPSVSSLVKALSHGDPHVRLYAAEALASIGPAGVSATKDLSKSLRDPIPGVRWAACEALASIGPAAAPAIPQLIEALKDEFLYVRICAAGALGSMGPTAATALESLNRAANDPTLHAEAEWALNRIAGTGAPGEHVASPVPPTVPVAPQPQASADLAPPAGELPQPTLARKSYPPLTRTRTRDGTSSGVSRWETRPLAVLWFPTTLFTWAPTMPGV